MPKVAVDGITPRQRRFIGVLMGAKSVEDAARLAEVGERTAHRWLTLPAFRSALSAALDDAMGQATRRAVAAMTEAVGTLEEVHTDGEAPTGARVSAARAILEAGPRLREASDLSQRLSELEAIVNAGDK